MVKEGFKQLVGNTGYLLLKMPQDILNEIKGSVDVIQSNFKNATYFGDALVGHIDKEYQTRLSIKSTNYIRGIVGEYCRVSPGYINKIYENFGSNPSLKYEGNAWINFQEKYEYNPMHHHNGVFSFVIWYQIPYYKEDEVKYGAGGNKDPGKNLNGEFEFVFYNGQAMITQNLGIDRTMEGYIAMFPSKLNHVVYPFYTSDDYRITISGNVFLQG